MEGIQRYSEYELFLYPNEVQRLTKLLKKKVKLKFIHKLNIELSSHVSYITLLITSCILLALSC